MEYSKAQVIGAVGNDMFTFLKRPDINEGVKRFRKTTGAILLDVRTDEEYKTRHIPGSINVPLEQIMMALDILEDKNAPIFSYCQRGFRSSKAVSALRKMGYTNVVNIGGIVAYKGETSRG